MLIYCMPSCGLYKACQQFCVQFLIHSTFVLVIACVLLVCFLVDSDGVDSVVVGSSSQEGNGKRTSQTADVTEENTGNYQHDQYVWRCAVWKTGLKNLFLQFLKC